MGKHYAQRSSEERGAIMMMKVGNCSVRHIARGLRHTPSTIPPELARFAT